MMISFVGYSDSGKTTLLSRVVSGLKEKGYRVAVIKHTERRLSFRDVDTRGKDTYKFCEAGADYVGLVSEGFFFLEGRREDDLFRLAGTLDVDFLLVEGFKEASIPKIVCARGREDLEGMGGEILAIVSDNLHGAIPSSDMDAILSLLIRRAGENRER